MDELNSRRNAPKESLKKPFSAKEQQALNILDEISSLIGDLWDRYTK
jgi:hypothetical protein